MANISAASLAVLYPHLEYHYGDAGTLFHSFNRLSTPDRPTSPHLCDYLHSASSVCHRTPFSQPLFAASFRSLLNLRPGYSVIAALICELAFVRESTQSLDSSYYLCDLTISEGAIQCLSIVTACWPQLKPFLTWARSTGLVPVPSNKNLVYRSNGRASTKESGQVASHELSGIACRANSMNSIAEWELDRQTDLSFSTQRVQSIYGTSQESFLDPILGEEIGHRPDGT